MKYFLIVLLLIVPFCAQAEDDWYGSVGGGVMIVHGIKPSKLEREIMSTPGVASSTSIENKSTYKSIALGHCFNDHVCLEGAYIWDAVFSTNLAISNINVGTIIIQGIPVNVGNLPADINLHREGSVSAVQISVLGKIAVSDRVDIFCRAGFYEYRVKITAKILLPQNLFLAKETEEIGTVPMASFGFDAKPFKKVHLRFEGQKTGAVSIESIALLYKF